MVKKLLMAALTLALSCLPAVAENLIQMRVQDEKIYEDTSFLLIVTARDRFDASALDTRPLLDDFTIGEVAYRYSEYENTTTWGVPLVTHGNGIIQIPNLLINNDSVAPGISISVRRKNGREPVPELQNLVKTEISRQNALINETLIIKTVVTKPHHVDLTRPMLDPSTDDGNIHQIYRSEDQKTTMGRSYSIITTVYAASFRTPGTHTIRQPVLYGNYAVSRTGGGNPTISNSAPGGAIRICDSSKSSCGDKEKRSRFVYQEKPLTVDVVAPAGRDNLVVADEFKIVETWDPEKNSTLAANSPIVHKITFSGTGVSAYDLPPRIIQGTPQYKAYTDQEKISEHYDPDTGVLTSQRTFSQVFVPLREMKLHFAPEEISWARRDADGTHLSIYSLTSPSYDIVSDGSQQYDFTGSNLTRVVLLAIMGIIILLIIACVLYLLYLEDIISVKPLARWNTRRKARSRLIRNFDTRDVRVAYSQLIEFGRVCFGENATCFEKFPNYPRFREYLDDIAKKRWNHGKSFTDPGYDGTEFRKVLKKFARG